LPRILRIIHRFSLSGPMFNAAYLAKYLEPEFETLVLGGVNGPDEKNAEYIFDDMNVNYRKLDQMGRSLNYSKDRQTVKQIRSIIKEFKPDIVHTHAAKAGAVGRFSAHREGVPVILHTFHGHVFHSYFNPLKTKFYINIERYLASKSTKIVAISPAQKKELSQDFSICPSDKIAIIPNGFELEKFETDQEAKRKKFRNEFNVEDEVCLIGIVGRLAPVKNHEMFIDLIPELFKTNDKLQFIIVGGGELENDLIAYAKEQNISVSTLQDKNPKASLIFASWRTDMDVVYSGLDLVFLCSLNEGTPVSLIEAQAASKAIVATKVGGITDTVLENESALLVPSNDQAAFAAAANQLIKDKAVRNKMATAGKSFVKKNYSRERLVNDYRELYNKLLSN